MVTTSPRSPASPGALGDSIMERDRLCAQIWKLARVSFPVSLFCQGECLLIHLLLSPRPFRTLSIDKKAGHIPHIDPDEVPSMIGSPSSHLASELDAARSAAKLDDAAFDGITAGCADEYRKFKAKASKTAGGGKRRKLGVDPARAEPKPAGRLNPRKKGAAKTKPKSPPRASRRASSEDGGPGPAETAPGSVTPDAEPAEPLFERTLVVSGKRKRAASAKARSLTLDDLVEEDDEEKEEEEERRDGGGGGGGGGGGEKARGRRRR